MVVIHSDYDAIYFQAKNMKRTKIKTSVLICFAGNVKKYFWIFVVLKEISFPIILVLINKLIFSYKKRILLNRS